MGVLFDECAEQQTGTRVHLDRPFDIDADARTHHTLPQLATLVREAAGWLAAAGAGPGDRVAIVKDNHWDYDLLACAAVRLGAVPAQLSAHLSGKTLATLLARLGPALLVTTARVLHRGRREGTDLASAARATLVLDDAVPGTLGMDDVRGHSAPGPRRRHDDEPLVIHHTSGTTGVPKLVVHSTRTIIGKLARFESVRLPRIGLRRTDVLANASAFAHGRTFCWTASALCMGPSADVRHACRPGIGFGMNGQPRRHLFLREVFAGIEQQELGKRLGGIDVGAGRQACDTAAQFIAAQRDRVQARCQRLLQLHERGRPLRNIRAAQRTGVAGEQAGIAARAGIIQQCEALNTHCEPRFDR
jgi:hypothetical protein